MIRSWPVEHRDGLIAYELDFDTAAEGEELREWIVERAELPLLQLFEVGEIVTAPPGGVVRFCEGGDSMADIVCCDDLDEVAFRLRFSG